MSTYTPDRWVVIEFVTPSTTFQKVFAGWYGGYTSGDSWKLNSGITKTNKDGDWFHFEGHSGSVYQCHPNGYGMSGYMSGIYQHWADQAFERGDIQMRILDIDEIAVS